MVMISLLPVLVLLLSRAYGTVVHDAMWRQQALDKLPPLVTLSAPYTPFLNDAAKTLNTAVVPKLAANAKALGVNVVWACGGMGQFDTLSVAERMELAQQWVEHGHANGLYVIVHVTSTVLSDAVALAQHAARIGADAVASLPPYYTQPPTLNQLMEFLKPIANAAGSLPMLYYHLPGSTHYDPNIYDLLVLAETELPSLIGVKYAGTNLLDWFHCVQRFNTTRALFFAPEPKLQAYGLGWGRGAVLAEDFYAATFLRMHNAYVSGDRSAAWREQEWKYRAEDVFSAFGGAAAKREVYKRMCSVDMGPPRLPSIPFDPAQSAALLQRLDAVDFFNRTQPPQGYN